MAAEAISPELHQVLRRFVERRVGCIQSGDRAGLDATYSPSCLSRQNGYNRHDFQWYLDLIERGFGKDIQRIDIQSADASAALPFAGMVTYPWPPEFKAFVQTVSGRRTLWLIRMFEDGPKVVLPAFGGKTGDQVATGEWKLPRLAERIAGASTTLKFHTRHFTSAVAESVSARLGNWSRRLKFETLRAAALDCAPWFGQCWIALLTTKEDFPEDEVGKGAVGEWRWAEVEEVGAENCQLIQAYYQGKTDTDVERTPGERAEVIFECLAKAFQSEQVASSFNRFDLAQDFEVGVFNPDDSKQRNYCNGSHRR
jgi:hypothetical protein